MRRSRRWMGRRPRDRPHRLSVASAASDRPRRRGAPDSRPSPNGKINGMKSAIDAAGRIVIPKAIRERLGLSRGRVVEIREREGRLEIEPAVTPMTLVRRARGRVAVPAEKLPPLTDDLVRATVDRTRR